MTRKRMVTILWSLVALALLVLAARPLRGGVAAQAPMDPSRFAQGIAQTPSPTVDIASATPVACDQVVVGTTVGAAGNVSAYGCAPWVPLTGPERVYSLRLSASTDVDALLGGLANDLDLLLLTGASPASCVAFGDNTISARGLAAGVYYLVVDGFNGASGPFQLNVWCPLAVTSTPTPTITPTPTLRPPPRSSYLPLLLYSSESR